MLSNKGSKLAAAFLLAACLGPVAAIPAAHASASAGATAGAAAAAAAAAAKARQDRTIATSPSAEAAMEAGLSYSLSHNFEICKTETGVTETAQSDISTGKARDFLSCLRDKREIDRFNAPSMEIAFAEYDMSEGACQTMATCRAENTGWDGSARLSSEEFAAVKDCVDEINHAATMKWLGIIGAAGLIGVGGVAAVSAMRRQPY